MWDFVSVPAIIDLSLPRSEERDFPFDPFESHKLSQLERFEQIRKMKLKGSRKDFPQKIQFKKQIN